MSPLQYRHGVFATIRLGLCSYVHSDLQRELVFVLQYLSFIIEMNGHIGCRPNESPSSSQIHSHPDIDSAWQMQTITVTHEQRGRYQSAIQHISPFPWQYGVPMVGY